MLSSEQVGEPRGRGRGSAGPCLRRGVRGWRRRGHRRQRSRGEWSGMERRGSLPASSLCPRQLLGLCVPPFVLPPLGGCYRGAALPPPPDSGRDSPGPRPVPAQKPRGDAPGEPLRCLSRGRLPWLGPAGLLSRAAAAAARVLGSIWKRRRLPAPLCPGEALGATPATLGWVGRQRRCSGRCSPTAWLPAGNADLAEMDSQSISQLGKSCGFCSPVLEDAEV